MGIWSAVPLPASRWQSCQGSGAAAHALGGEWLARQIPGAGDTGDGHGSAPVSVKATSSRRTHSGASSALASSAST